MRVFSGIQPTNQLHIGNYLGAIKQWLTLQNTHECLFCIVDWHAITVPYETKELQKRINEVAIIYLAAGLDAKKSIIFVQSQVKEHTELAWLLNTIIPVGDLTRMTQYKEKSQKHKKNVCAGLLNYPILMAADILLYQADFVPVGEDQKQHVELTREVVRKFNSRFGKTFKLPHIIVPKIGAKIMSLTEPTKKMSKSDPSESRIGLFDSPAEIKKKIAGAITDSGKEIKYNVKEKPGISNLLAIYALFSEKTIGEVERIFQNKGYADFKEKLSLLLIEKLEPFRKAKEYWNKKPDLLKKILNEGAKKAQKIALQTMLTVRKKMGLQ